TLAGWLYLTGNGQDWHTIAAKELGGGTFSSYAIFEDATGGSNLRYLSFFSGGGVQRLTSDFGSAPTALSTGTWYYMAFTWASGGPPRLRVWNTAGSSVFNDAGSNYTGTISYDTGAYRLGGISGEVSASRMGTW